MAKVVYSKGSINTTDDRLSYTDYRLAEVKYRRSIMSLDIILRQILIYLYNELTYLEKVEILTLIIEEQNKRIAN